MIEPSQAVLIQAARDELIGDSRNLDRALTALRAE